MDIERTMQFILEEHAKFVTDLHEVRTLLVEVAAAQERTNAIVETLAERHIELVQRHEELQQELAQSHQDLARSHQELAEKQKITEENLNALILTVERHL